MGEITFLKQSQPIDEYGRALYAVARSILRAQLDNLSAQDLRDFSVDSRDKISLRQLARYARLERDSGMRGDGFEWAVHEAIVGKEPRVIEPLAHTLTKVSPKYRGAEFTSSLMFGQERAQYLGFLDSVVREAGSEAVLLPDGQGHPYKFTSAWLQTAARGHRGEDSLGRRIKKIWKTDLFISDQNALRYTAATVKSNPNLLEGGAGLRVGIVPASTQFTAGTRRDQKTGLWLTVLPDPDGFMGLFNDAYWGVASAIYTVGKHERPPYYMKPSAKSQRMVEQILKYENSKVIDICEALDNAAQQGLVSIQHELVSVQAPPWLSIREKAANVIAPKPSFVQLD